MPSSHPEWRPASAGVKAGRPESARGASPPFRSPAHEPTRNHFRGLHAPPERSRRDPRPSRRSPTAGHALGRAGDRQVDDRPAGRGRRQPPVCRRPGRCFSTPSISAVSPGATATAAPAGRRRCSCRRPTMPASGSSTSKSCRPACRWCRRRSIQLALERKVGEYALPEGASLIACGIRATLDRIAPEYDVTRSAPATDLSRIAIYIALTADRNPAFPTLSRIARAGTEAPVHGVSPATAHMHYIVRAIRPRSRHRWPVPAAPLDKTANLLEHCRSNAHRRETVNRTELWCAHRRPLYLDQGRCRHRAARGRRNPRTGEAVSIPARTVPAFNAGTTLRGRLDGQHGESAVRWRPFGREPLPGRPRSFATHPQQRDAPDSPLPSRILPRRRPSRSHAHCAPAITLPPLSSGCRLPPGRPVSMTFSGREKRSGIGRFATGATACADQPPTSDPSRAGTLIWRAAGLLR